MTLLKSAEETHKDTDLSSLLYGNKPGNKTGEKSSGRRSRQSSLSRKKNLKSKQQSAKLLEIEAAVLQDEKDEIDQNLLPDMKELKDEET